MSIRSRIARWLDPEAAHKAKRYDRMVDGIHTDVHWLTAYPDAADAMWRILEKDNDHWRSIGAPASGTRPDDISRFREFLGSRSDSIGNDPTKPNDFIEAWWAETGTSGMGDGCNKPFWLRREATEYVQAHGGYIAPLYRRQRDRL